MEKGLELFYHVLPIAKSHKSSDRTPGLHVPRCTALMLNSTSTIHFCVRLNKSQPQKDLVSPAIDDFELFYQGLFGQGH